MGSDGARDGKGGSTRGEEVVTGRVGVCGGLGRTGAPGEGDGERADTKDRPGCGANDAAELALHKESVSRLVCAAACCFGPPAHFVSDIDDAKADIFLLLDNRPLIHIVRYPRRAQMILD